MNCFVGPQIFEELRQSVTVEEQRAFIKLSVILGKRPTEVYDELSLISPENHLSRSRVFQWYKDFRDGTRTEIADRPVPGRPRTSTNEANKEWVKQLILESEGMKTNDLIYETGIPKTSLLKILDEIGAKKVSSRWCPHELTDAQKHARHHLAGKHLARYQKEPGFLNKIVAIDETWLKSYDPKDAKQTKEWLLPSQRP